MAFNSFMIFPLLLSYTTFHLQLSISSSFQLLLFMQLVLSISCLFTNMELMLIGLAWESIIERWISLLSTKSLDLEKVYWIHRAKFIFT